MPKISKWILQLTRHILKLKISATWYKLFTTKHINNTALPIDQKNTPTFVNSVRNHQQQEH